MYQKRNRELEIVSLYLGDYQRQLYLREVNRLTNIPLKTTQSLLISLEKSRIIKSSIIGKNKYFKLNLNNIQTKLYLIQSEVHNTFLFLDNYPHFNIFLKEIKSNNLLLVFGSFAKFTANKTSDLDLLIIHKKKEEIPTYLLPYQHHQIKLSEVSFIKSLEKQDTLIKEIEEKHIILNNHSFYVNIMWDHYAK